MEFKEKSIDRFAHSVFGRFFVGEKEKYEELEKTLLAARYPITFDIYLSSAFLYALLTGVLGLIVGFMLANLLSTLDIIPINYEVFPSAILAHGQLFGKIFLSLFGFIVFFSSTYALIYLWPSSKAGDRRREIDRMMPHAVHYMYALSKSGISILDIIKSLATHEDTYGEIAKEMDFIVREVEYFGKDLRGGLIQLSETTPSNSLKEFISGILTIIESGGSLPLFLAEKAEQYRERARVEQKGFLETLGLLAETYITAIVAAPLMFLIVEIIMLAMGTGSLTAVQAIVYLMIPLGSAFFVVFIYMITPSDIKKAPILKTEFEEEEKKQLESEEVKESGVYKAFKAREKMREVKEYIKKPFEKMQENPLLSLAMSVPIAIALLLILGTGWIVPALFVGILPLTVFYESKARYERRIRNQAPDILRGMSSSVASGLTLMKTTGLIADAGERGMYKEVKKMNRSIEWGSEVGDAFKNLANRVKVASLTRAVTLLTEVLRTGGNMPEALSISAKDAEIERTLVKERAVNMLIYILILYIAFGVFLGIIYMLFTSLLPPLFEAFRSTAGMGGAGMPFGTALKEEEISSLLLQATVFQSLFCGLMAGQMGEGNILAGLKHVLLMLFITWVLFTFFI